MLVAISGTSKRKKLPKWCNAQLSVWKCVCARVCWSLTYICIKTSAPAVDFYNRQQGRRDEQVQLQEYQSNPATWATGSYTVVRWHFVRISFFYLDELGPLACSHSELIWDYRSYRQSMGLFGWVISPLQGRYLHRASQTEESRSDIHASSGIRTHDPSVWEGEEVSCPKSWGHCNRHFVGIKIWDSYLYLRRVSEWTQLRSKQNWL
jgi:hypothetical protein